jgi:hypothetical protein
LGFLKIFGIGGPSYLRISGGNNTLTHTLARSPSKTHERTAAASQKYHGPISRTDGISSASAAIPPATDLRYALELHSKAPQSGQGNGQRGTPFESSPTKINTLKLGMPWPQIGQGKVTRFGYCS